MPMPDEQIAPVEPNPSDLVGHMLALVKEAGQNRNPIMMCACRHKDDEVSFENARMYLTEYRDAISMVGRLLQMVTSGTGVSLETALDHLKVVHADFDETLRKAK